MTNAELLSVLCLLAQTDADAAFDAGDADAGEHLMDLAERLDDAATAAGGTRALALEWLEKGA